MRFLEARAPGDRRAPVILQGAPWDEGVSYRSGAALAPQEIRAASDSIESYSPRTGRDLVEIDLVDAGDIELPSGTAPEGALERIAAATAEHARTGAVIVTLGGDHSISVGTARGLRTVHSDLAHIVYDAHMDLRAEYGGSSWSHACGSRHLALAGPTAVLGVRSGAREEYADADRLLVAWTPALDIPESAARAIAGRPLLVSVDLDVLDPSILPGTGNPEPGGPSYLELREALLGLYGRRIVGLDLCEVAPALDPSGLSPVVAAELARECILGLLAPHER